MDPRVTPARRDLAAAHLEGLVQADRFVAGERRAVIADVADVRRAPRLDAALDTQATHGEIVTVYDEEEGWAWVQLERDGYVGYVASHALGQVRGEPTHVVVVNRTFLYPAPDMKRAVLGALPLAAVLCVVGMDGAFARLSNGCYVFGSHVMPCAHIEGDYVAVAERLLHSPYLWGGTTPLGIDCSGLVQRALGRSGVNAPRDTDMQERALGDPVPVSEHLDSLVRGDLVFWRGHVGIMIDATRLIHANAHHMAVAIEPLREAAYRIAANGQAFISSVRRLQLCKKP